MTTYGWAGKILRVNFTSGEVTNEDTEKYKDYVGGMGIGYKIIYDEVPLDTHPHDEASKVVLAFGPLTGSGVPCSGRSNFSLLSSWTKGRSIVDGHMGGHIAHAIKYAGYDAVIFEGRSDKPVYLKIHDDKVTIEDASHIWGKGTFESNKVLVKENGSGFDAATIGQAGENLLDMSCIITSGGNSAGAGVGAVLGSKKVKGFVVKGTGSVKVADAKEVKSVSDYMMKELIGGNNNHNVPAVPQSWAEYSAPSGKNRWSGAPGRGWEKGQNGFVDMGEQPVGDIDKIAFRSHKGNFDHGEIADKYMVKVGGCSSCPIRCYAEYDIDPLEDYDLPTKVSNTCMPIIFQAAWYPEGIKDFEVEGDANMVICGAGARAVDDYGLWDNYGNIQRDFNHCYKSGILKEKLPAEEYNSMPWDLMKDGDPRWVVEIVKRIATKQGEISKLGLGTYNLIEEWDLGKEYMDTEYLQNVTYNGYPKHHGTEDVWQTGQLYNMMYNRDCMVHNLTNVIQSGSPYELYKRVIEEDFGFGEGAMDKPQHYTPMNKNKAKLAKYAFLGKQWHDMATLCNWMYPMTLSPSKDRNYVGDIELDAKYMTAVTGDEWNREKVDLASERVSNMLRVMTAISFDLNEGSKNLRQDHDTMPAWLFDKDPDFEAFEEGTTKMDRDDMEIAKTMFYEEMGWNVDTGIPTRETLERLDLGDMADDLDARGLL